MREKGFWDKPRNKGEAIGLMHSELSEMYEALQQGSPPSEKCPGYTHTCEEGTDLLYRIADYVEGFGVEQVANCLAHLFDQNDAHDDCLFDDEFIAQVHVYLSRVLEAARHGEPQSKEIVWASEVAVNLAKTIKAVVLFCEHYSWDVWGCLTAKHEYNKTRPRLHGKQF